MKSHFVRSVGKVLTGTMIAQLIPIAGTLVLARIFDPASFGIFSAWLGMVLLLAVVVTGRFETALAIEADGYPRRTAVAMTLITILIMSSIFLVFFGLAGLIELDFLSRLPMVLLLLAVPSAAFVAAMQVLQNWAAADGRYRHLATMRIAQAALIVILQIAFGLVRGDATSLGSGYLVGACLGLGIGFLLKPLSMIDFGDLSAKLKSFLKKHRRFMIYSLPADSVSAAAAQLPVLVVAARFGAEAAGLLAMALRMLGAPMSLLAASVLDVFKRHAGQAYRERGECESEYLHAFRLLLGVAVAAALAIYFGAETCFAMFFGASWLGAGTMALWLLPRFAIGFVASPLSYMVYIAGKQHLDLIWQLAVLVVTLSTLLLIDSTQWALISYGFGYSIFYFIYLLMSYSFSRGRAN